MKKAKYKIPVICSKTGYIEKLNAEEVGKIASFLGAGRVKKEDEIDYSVGIELVKKVGDKVATGECLAYIYANDEQKANIAVQNLLSTYKISEKKVDKICDILEIIE